MNALKRFGVILALLLSISSCAKPKPETRSIAGPNDRAREIVGLLGAGDAAGLLERARGRMAEMLEVIEGVAADRERFCAALSRLEDEAIKARAAALRAATLKKLVWSSAGIELEGRIERGETKARYRLAAIDEAGGKSPRVLILEREGLEWYFTGFDEGPNLETIVPIRNQFNQLRYAIDGIVDGVSKGRVTQLDPQGLQVLRVLEGLFGTA